MEDIGGERGGCVRDVKMASCDGIDGSVVCAGEYWPGGVSGVRSVVGEDVGITLSNKNVCSAGVGSERDARLVHGKHTVVRGCGGVGVGVGVWVGVGVEDVEWCV